MPFLELLELDVDLVNLDAQIDLEVGQFFHLLLDRTNQVLEVRAKIIGYLVAVFLAAASIAIDYDGRDSKCCGNQSQNVDGQ